MTTPTWGTIC